MLKARNGFTKKLHSLCLIFCLMFFGCSIMIVPPTLKPLNNIPASPTFTVIPEGLFYKGFFYKGFSDEISGILIDLGLQVFIPPIVKKFTEQKSAGVSQKIQDSTEKTGKAITEDYFAYDEIKTDYIIFADNGTWRIKIIETKTQKIVASFQVGSPKRSFMHDALLSLGFKVKK